MSQCCPLSSPDDGLAAEIADETRTARKAHRCDECREPIPAKTKYRYFAGVYDGEFFTHRRCLECAELQAHFGCEGYIFGELWSGMQDGFFPTMTAGGPCMEGLSASAKAKLFAEWRKWKGLDAARG